MERQEWHIFESRYGKKVYDHNSQVYNFNPLPFVSGSMVSRLVSVTSVWGLVCEGSG